MDVKGSDRKTSLLHFVCKELLKTAPTVSALNAELAGVREAASLSFEALVLQLGEVCAPCSSPALVTHALHTRPAGVCNLLALDSSAGAPRADWRRTAVAVLCAL